MMKRFAAIAVAAIRSAQSPVLAQDKLPPLKTGVDGTFAPHAMPKLGGGIEGFQIDLFTEVAKRMHRDIIIDAVSFSTLIPGMQSGRYDFIAAPTTVTKERAENMLFTAGYLWTAFQFGIKKGTRADQGLGGPQGQVRRRQQGHALRDAVQADGREVSASRCRSTTPSPTPRRPCSRAAPTPPWAATRSIVYTASKNPQFVADLELKDTRAHWAAPVPQGQLPSCATRCRTRSTA